MLTLLLILSIILVFFRGTVFLFAGLPFQVFYLTVIPLFGLYLLNLKQFLKQILFVLRNTPGRYLIYFVIYLYLSGAILWFTGKSSILIFYYLTVKLMPVLLLSYLLPAVFVPRYFPINKVIKIFFGISFFIFIFGIVGFLADLYNITPISACVNFISNAKQLIENVSTTLMADETSGLPRARSIFGEPQNLGWFVFVSLPIYFKVCLGQYRIYKNKFWNIVIKKSLIPLAYVNAFLCMSPIALLAITILTLSFLGKSIFKHIRKYMLSISTGIVLVLGSISLIFIFAQDALMNFVESSFLARALNVIHSMKDFETLVEVEPSLASRITSFTNSFILFLKHPLMGLGYDNARFYMYDQFLHSPLPLTKENYGRMLVDVVTGSGTWFSKATLFTLLVDTGIIGTGLFYTFLIKSVIVANKIKNKFTGLEFKFIDGLRVSYIAMISVSFYLYMLFDTVQCFCFGLLCSFVYAAKNRKLTSNEEENLHE